MPRDDTPNWLTEGLAEVQQAGTLEEARDAARGLVLNATARLVEHLETHLVNNPIRGANRGHPLYESLRSYKEARLALDDVYADMRQTGYVT